MLGFLGSRGVSCIWPALLALSGAFAQNTASPDSVKETIQVTATRTPEASDHVAASVSVVDGDDLRALGATDLAGALALVAGVSIAPGGDGGPASSVPELWGLREFDAFLLVVDGVPWGGAFNPALASLDLTHIDRIEVLRGPAPVMFGATSFVGVIQVLRREAGSGERSADAAFGQYGSWRAATYLPLPDAGGWKQSVSAGVTHQGLRDDRAGFTRGHLLYRGLGDAFGGRVRFDAELVLLGQEPTTPHLREGSSLSSAIPLDANHHPADAKQDEDRLHLVAGYTRRLDLGTWSTTFALDRVERQNVKGFLFTAEDTAGDNAAGYSQEQEEVGLYFDSHWQAEVSPVAKVIVGVDHLYGMGESEGANFRYHTNLDGSGALASGDVPILEFTELEDARNFSGLYGQVAWQPTPRWRVEAGARLNLTHEEREAEAEPFAEEEEEEEEEGGMDARRVTRGSGTLGVNYAAWQHDRDGVWLFADYRNAFKPAAIDFGPEAEAVEILKPETAESLEAGIKGHCLGGRADFMVSAFQMDFANLVVSAMVDGLPVLENGGEQRFEGFELETGLHLAHDGLLRLSWSHHDARFRDYVRAFDGVPTQLSGNHLELTPHELAAAGFLWAPAHGLEGSLVVNYVGDRYLNKRNTARAEDYTLLSAGIGWHSTRWSARLDCRNLSDARDPVSESELGESQYYRLQARTLEAGVHLLF